MGATNLMPSPGSWITAALYFWAAYGCRTTAIRLDDRSRETAAWTALAILLALLGVSELLQLQPAMTQFGRSIAYDEGWYWHRHDFQAVFTKVGTAVTVVLSFGLLFAVRRASLQCAIAVACAVMIVGYIVVRAVSLHQVDALLMRTTFGVHWSRIPELTGSLVILFTALSRRQQAAPARQR